MRHARRPSFLGRIAHGFFVVAGACVLTVAVFLVLPLIQAITKQPDKDTVLQSMDTAALPPPPPPIEEEEPEPEPEEEPPPPELAEDVPLLDLAQLELALNATVGEGFLGGDFASRLITPTAAGEDLDALFSLADLDLEPRATHRANPAFTAKLRKRAPATVYVLFIVDQRGRVENPIVQQSTDPLFDSAALAAIKQWRFEPGRRKGEPVRFRMRQPITFPD